ncbi:nucleus export protein Brl1p [Monosporozyma servazzii]
MDQFNRLSLDDDDKGLDSDIWNLSLNDTSVNHHYARDHHYSTTLMGNYIDNNNSSHVTENNNNYNMLSEMEVDSVHSPSIHEMDIDMVEIQSDIQSDIQQIQQTQPDIQPDIQPENDQKQDILSDTESIHTTDNSIDKSSNVSKLLLLSPTQLGASLVTNNNNNNTNTSINTDHDSHIRQNNNNKDIWKQLLTDKQLINVNINNHNYYSNDNNYPNDNYNNNNNNLIMERDDLLPLPWSTVSTPYFKKWYNSISFIQWGLNAFSILFIIYLLLSSMSKDMKAIWYQNKINLINESQNCQLQYNLNHCDINYNLPEMSQICQDWWICSHRDNTKLIINRTNLLIKFLTSLINEVINELNWKTLFVSIILILGWFFISNFTMGFIRAKSYYGAPNKIKTD